MDINSKINIGFKDDTKRENINHNILRLLPYPICSIFSYPNKDNCLISDTMHENVV